MGRYRPPPPYETARFRYVPTGEMRDSEITDWWCPTEQQWVWCPGDEDCQHTESRTRTITSPVVRVERKTDDARKVK